MATDENSKGIGASNRPSDRLGLLFASAAAAAIKEEEEE